MCYLPVLVVRLLEAVNIKKSLINTGMTKLKLN